MHYLSYHCSVKKCMKEPHNSSRQQSPRSYAGLSCRWWNSQIPWQWWITPVSLNSDAKRSVKATDVQSGGALQTARVKLWYVLLLSFHLDRWVLKWNYKDAKPSQWAGWSISTWQWCEYGGFSPGQAWAGAPVPHCPPTTPVAQLAPQTLTKGPWHMVVFPFSSIVKQFSKYIFFSCG